MTTNGSPANTAASGKSDLPSEAGTPARSDSIHQAASKGAAFFVGIYYSTSAETFTCMSWEMRDMASST